KKNVAPDERIVEASCKQATPRDDAVRPVSPDEGLQGHVEDPDDAGQERGETLRRDELVPLVGENGCMVRAQDPPGEDAEEDGEGEPEGSLSIAPAETQVPPREIDRGGQRERQEYHVQETTGAETRSD